MFSGFDRLCYDNTSTDMILDMYERFWGVPLPQEHTSLKDSVLIPSDSVDRGHDTNDEENDEENGKEDDGDLLPATPDPVIDIVGRRLLIRAEYLRIYKWVEDCYEEGNPYRPSAIIVTGQPGIGQYSIMIREACFVDTPPCVGKSFWAYYVLRRRLGEKSTVLWFQAPALYLFCSEGVLIVPHTFTFTKFTPRIWTIIDSADSPVSIPTTLAGFLPGVFPIYLTSPRPARWSGITQSWTAHRIVMNPWTRAEIEYG